MSNIQFPRMPVFIETISGSMALKKAVTDTASFSFYGDVLEVDITFTEGDVTTNLEEAGWLYVDQARELGSHINICLEEGDRSFFLYAR